MFAPKTAFFFFYYDFIVLFFVYSGKYRTFALKFDYRMKKEVGKWFMDIDKYAATTDIISSFLGGFDHK